MLTECNIIYRLFHINIQGRQLLYSCTMSGTCFPLLDLRLTVQLNLCYTITLDTITLFPQMRQPNYYLT